MKKLLLSTALISSFICSAAHAENSVTLYGVLDGGYGYSQTRETVDSNQAAVLGKLNPDGSVMGHSGHYSSLGTGGNYRVRYQYSADGGYTSVVTGPSLHTVTRDEDIGFQSGISSDTFWGMKGEEEIGGGTRAIFTLESNFDLGSGHLDDDGRLFDREAYVGLQGDWGTFTLGRSDNAADAVMADIDPFGTDYSMAAATSTFGSMLSTKLDNEIKYMSPEFGGFSFVVAGFVNHHDRKESGLRSTLSPEQYLQGDQRQFTNDYTGQTYTYGVPFDDKYRERHDMYGVSAAVQYDMDPIVLGASYDLLWSRDKESGFNGSINLPATRSLQRAHMWSVGATYDFDVAKLHLMYGQAIDGLYGLTDRDDGELDDGLFNPLNNANYVNGVDPLARGYRLQAWMAGVTVPMFGEDGNLMFSYQGNTQKNNRDEANINPDDHAKSTGHVFSLGYTHNISKRTRLWALASYGTSKERTHDEWDTEYKLRQSIFAVGMTHRF